MTQYPEITPPTVEVSTIYPGANAQVVADTVAAPIEQQVNGVENMMYLSSQCTNDGNYVLTVTFEPGTDLNLAQIMVQNRVSLAEPILPDLVKRRGVTVKKKSPSVLMIVNLYSPDGSRDNLYLSNYATIQLRDELSRVPGVGAISFLGQRDYSMRVWLDPQQMAMRGISSADVVRAIEQQNTQVAAGQIGQPPAPTGQVFQYTMSTLGRLTDDLQFGDMILRADSERRIIRLRDVARIELGALAYDQVCTLDTQPSVALSIYQRPGSNALETAQQVRDKVDELKFRFPEGVDYKIVYDTTPFIRESINEVFGALRDAVVLVAIVVLVFLQGWRAAIIPLVAVPVAIVGTFAAMAAAQIQLEYAHAVRPGAGGGYRGRRRHRGRRGHRAPHRRGEISARCRDPRHARGGRPGDRRRVGAFCRVRAVRIHLGRDRAVLSPIRRHDRDFHDYFRLQFADPQPGPRRPFAQTAAQRTRRGVAARRPGDRRRVGRQPALGPLARSVEQRAAERYAARVGCSLALDWRCGGSSRHLVCQPMDQCRFVVSFSRLQPCF